MVEIHYLYTLRAVSIKLRQELPICLLDRAGISATSAELQGERLEVGDRILATTTIDFDNQGTQLAQGIYNATIAGVHKSIVKAIHSTILYPLLLVTHCPSYMV